ncbi:MAG: serine/threonine-protein phosphatase [Planctomycetes bacterium]|nr:serine/threonine-protein phosphatase [Planctomycetota bacterium]
MSDTKLNWDDCLQYDRASDIGMRRSNNQDSYAVEIADDEETWQQRGHVFLVADGMGAHAAGELASSIAAERVPTLYLKYRDQSAPEALQRAIIDTNSEVHSRGKANEEFHNMGTTCCVLALLPQGVIAGHLGDSRIYRVRGGHLEQLTFDHSLVWEMRAAGQLKDNDGLANIVPKNVITRSLGPNPIVKVDIEGPFPVELGDSYLLCSDGLTGQIPDDELGQLVDNLSPQEAVRVLVDLSNLRGGPDNITLIIFKVTGKKLTTEQAATEPIKLGSQPEERKVSPIWWAMMGACFLAGTGMALLQSWLPAGMAAVAGLVFLATILIQHYDIKPGRVLLKEGERFGRGPYTKTESVASLQVAERLADIIRQLRDAANEQEWDVDWSPLDELCQKAADGVSRSDYAEALRRYGRGISFMMEQARAQSKSSDSSIDLA